MRNDVWDNVNAYTYVKVRENTDREAFVTQVAELEHEYLEAIAKEYELKFEPRVQQISEIHLSPPMEEDFAMRANPGNLYILQTVVVLFLLTGLINYLNISQAEITGHAKKYGILRVFGGLDASKSKVGLADALLCLLFSLPLCLLFLLYFLRTGHAYLGVTIDSAVWTELLTYAPIAVLFLGLLFATRFHRNALPSLKNESPPQKSILTWTSTLVAGQLTFSVMIISLMAVIMDQFQFIERNDKGFNSSNTIVIPTPGFDSAQSRAFVEAVASISGVSTAESCSYVPGGGVETKEFFEVESSEGMRRMLVNYINVGYNYVDLLNIRIKSGRNFDPEKSTDIMGAYLINETAATQLGWKDPIGKKINGPLEADGREGEVIGVLGDFHYASIHSPIEPLIIFLNENWDIHFIYVKLNPTHPSDILFRIEDQYRKTFSATMDWTYLDDRYMNLYQEDNRLKNVFASALLISVIVSCLGIFSISALVLIRRTREMAIRKVVGASQPQLFFVHIKSFLLFMIVSVCLAGPLSYLIVQQWLETFAYHVKFSGWHVGTAGLFSFTIVASMTGLHAWRAALVNPAEVLKGE
jgi:putative ABC transport system permease protein